LDNLDLLDRGGAVFALATADVVEAYLAGPAVAPPAQTADTTPGCEAVIGPTATVRASAPSGVAGEIQAVARLYDSYVHLLTAADAPVNRLADLRGLRVSVGVVGSGTALVADRILTRAGIDPHADIDRYELNLDQTIAALRADCIDAFFIVEGLGAPEVARVADLTNVRLVDLADVSGADYGPAYHVAEIPQGTYEGQPVAVVTVAVPTLLLTTEAVGDETVRAMTELLFSSAPALSATIEAVGQIDRHAAIFTSPVALHDGARTYYRATKIAA
jgi:TRAP transporter TAXI family solute receptor